ncbi:DUF1059 domain-containing protein [Nitrosopumilus ureiphilus]|uniref:DUF1059 domain-containing protein n=2 Tax=Nitrosopumilus ureiphilus TaxID=1470067 RepID=A0A7D5MA64_9ARCH|nr:DUF1059 domain-containing protein [Nitrosopumilus ureiphilus]
MVKILCAEYGFDCVFQVIGDASEVIEKFQKHSIDAHGIEYSMEGLMKLLLRMKN